MNRNKNLINIIRLFAILMVIMSVLLIIRGLMIDIVPITRDGRPEYYTYKLTAPHLEWLPGELRSGHIKKLLHSIMMALSFFGGLRIGILLLNNRDRLRRMHNHGLQRIAIKSGSR